MCRPAEYELVLGELRETGEISHETRRRLAAKAFATTAAYEAAIAGWFARPRGVPRLARSPSFEKALDLAYGENPHQRAAYYAERGARRHLLARVEQLHGSELSFNNLNDLNAAPHGRARVHAAGLRDRQAREPVRRRGRRHDRGGVRRALAADPISAYGGVVVLNRPVSAALGERLAEQFVEVLFAPGYDEVAVEALVQKQSIRILNDMERRSVEARERDYKRVLGGLLVQDRDWDVADREGMRSWRGEPERDDVGRPALRLAGVQARGVERDRDRQGPADDRDRRGPDEPRRRRPDRRREGGRAGARRSTALCSPRTRSSRSPTGRRLALDAGVTALIQPGGSKRDADVVAAVEAPAPRWSSPGAGTSAIERLRSS